MVVLFLICAVIILVSAVAVIFMRNVVHSALALMVNFGTLAVFYFMLNAQFLGVAQILVYAGAIVVLFLFVVMLLGAEFGEPVSDLFSWRTGVMTALGLLLLTVVGTAVFENPVQGQTSDFTPEAVATAGQAQMIGAALFTDYVLAFHLVALLLTVGVIGVVWLGQQQQLEMGRHDVPLSEPTSIEDTSEGASK